MPSSQHQNNPTNDTVTQLVDDLGVTRNRQLSETFVTEALGLVADQPQALNLKIASAVITEMRDAFEVFEPYHDVPKVTIFGSARTQRDDPLYLETERVAAALADRGWMVVTGAGPGIMEAGNRGAGRDRTIGVSIRLPFESGANSVIAGDSKHVAMRYFFTRKLMLVKESSGFLCMPGGFGTLDETFELLTLTQTGKGVPVPIVFQDLPGDDYWAMIDRFVTEQLVPRGMVNQADLALYRHSSSADETVAEIVGFYRNYHSIRFVGDDIIIRLRYLPTDAQVGDLNRDFSHLVKSGQIRTAEPYQAERRDDDYLDLPRLAFAFNRRGFAELRAMIDRLNSFAPPSPSI